MERNSWCKVVDGEIVDGPRAWQDNTPPDNTWVPHVIDDPEHTINDKFLGSTFVFDAENSRVVETNRYGPKTAEEIAAEVAALNSRATNYVEYAEQVLLQPELANRAAWENFKSAWEQLTDVTELSWDYYTPPPPSPDSGITA